MNVAIGICNTGLEVRSAYEYRGTWVDVKMFLIQTLLQFVALAGKIYFN